jgi:hypothetical protein
MDKPKDRDKGSTSSGAASKRAKRKYKTPALTEYGSIARLTHTGGSSAREGAQPLMRPGCL